MPEPIMQRLVHRVTPTSNTPIEVELGPFALSFLTIDIIRSQPTANAELTPVDMVSWINRVSVWVRGVSVWDMSGVDSLVIGSALYANKMPARMTSKAATTRRHIANIIVPFSRRPFMPVSGLPSVGRGEALLRIEPGTVPSGTLLSVHGFGWKEHKPDWTVRCVRVTANIPTTGDADIPLAPAGPILGLGLYEDDPYMNSATARVDNLRLLIQGVEDTFNSVNLEGLVALEALTTKDLIDQIPHQHIENTASAYTQNATTLTNQSIDELLKYTIVMLDETFDPDTIIAIPPGAQTSLRVSASATGTVRVFPIEMFVVPERPRPATPA